MSNSERINISEKQIKTAIGIFERLAPGGEWSKSCNPLIATKIIQTLQPFVHFAQLEAYENDFMCEECGDIISEEEWEIFGGKCEECNLQL